MITTPCLTGTLKEGVLFAAYARVLYCTDGLPTPAGRDSVRSTRHCFRLARTPALLRGDSSTVQLRDSVVGAAVLLHTPATNWSSRNAPSSPGRERWRDRAAGESPSLAIPSSSLLRTECSRTVCLQRVLVPCTTVAEPLLRQNDVQEGPSSEGRLQPAGAGGVRLPASLLGIRREFRPGTVAPPFW